MKHNRLRGLYFIISVISLFGHGCATVKPPASSYHFSLSDYENIASFSGRNNFTFSFDTIDDIIVLNSEQSEVKILVSSLAVLVNGSALVLKVPPLYRNGEILVPRQLGEILRADRFVDFRPLFNIKTIVLDPGHGGKDPGAVSPGGLQEKVINLIIAKDLQQKLTARGYKVVMTRTRDIFLSLAERAEVARRNNADLFISIHANANRSSKVSGVEIYYLSADRLESGKRAAKMSREGRFFNRTVDKDAAVILWDLLFTNNHSLSIELSSLLHFNFRKMGFSVKPPRTAGFYVLRNAYVPAVLVETGYLTNANEERALRRSYYQRQISEAIVLSIDALSRRYTASGGSATAALVR